MTGNNLTLSGTWEQSSRNPLVAAFILVFICGGLYFFIASLILQLYVTVDIITSHGSVFTGDMDYVDYIKEYISRYKIVSLSFTAVFQYLGFLVFPILVIKKWHTPQIKEYFHYDHLHLPGIILSVFGVLFIMPLVDIISNFFFNLFPVFEKLSELSTPLLQANNPGEMIFIVFVISITPAICEEAIFRGYFQRTLQRKLKFPWHFIISGFVFALFHQQTLSLVALFLVGIYLGYIYYCFSSIYVSMAAHSLYNFILIFFLNSKEKPGFLFTENGDYHVPVVLVSLVLFLLVIFFIYTFRMREPEPSEDSVE
ncbi:MAG: CPBP family intramembrane metalloprotease [Spirochaetales bacterium]|nr:CPBP family intramembrane metalloprotease [Spirochaetales bacterium]